MSTIKQPVCLPAPPPVEPETKAPQGSSILKQINAHYKELEQQAGVMSTAAQLEMRLQKEFVISVANLSAAVPVVAKHNRLESNLAALLGWKRWIWQSTQNATEAGAVRQALKERSNTAGELVRLLALNKSLPKIRQLQRELTLTAKNYVSPQRVQELLYDEVVVGNYPKLLNVTDSPLVYERINQKYLQHKKALLEAGLPEAAQEKLGMLAEEISHTFDEVRAVAGKAGFDIDRLENGGYFPIQATEEFNKYLRQDKETWLSGYDSLQEIMQKKRVTNVPIVADLDHLAKLFQKQLTGIELPNKSLLNYTEFERKTLVEAAETATKRMKEIRLKNLNDVDAGNKAVAAFLKKQTKDVQALLQLEQAKIKLLDLNSRPGDLSTFLNSNFSEGQLKSLFEAGYLQQMPAMTDELLEFYRGIDVGVRGLADAIVLDPEQAIRSYSDSLYKAVKEHNLFKTAFDQGAEAGWVTDVLPKGNEASYIRVGSSPKLRKWIDDSALAASVSDLYIHRTAADQLNGLLEINTSPHKLQSLASAWNAFSQVFRKSLLLSGGLLGYIPRVFSQNVIAHYAATGSLASLPLSIVDSIRVLSKGFDGLDNVKEVYNIGGTNYSLAALYKELLAQRGGSASSSLYEARNVADNLRQYFPFSNGQSAERARHFNALYQKRYGNPLTGVTNAAASVGKTAEAGFNAAYGVLSFTNQFLDNAFRWASFREMAASGKYNSVEEILRKLDNYYSINGDGGVVGNAVGSVAMPFATFAINAPGAAFRHALTHPWRAANVMRLYSLAQSEDNLTEAELPSYLRDNESYFMTIYRDPDTGERGIIMPQTVDFLLDSYTFAAKLANNVAGTTPKSVTNYVDGKLNSEKGLQDAFKAAVAKSYVGNIGLSLAGVDPQTLQAYDNDAPSDTLLGVPVSRATRSLLTHLSPLLRSLDKDLPTALVGQAPARDTDLFGFSRPNTGTPGLFGAVPTTGGTPQPKPFSASVDVFQRLTGLNVSEVDPRQNLLRTYKDFGARQADIRKTRLALYRNLLERGVPRSDKSWQRFEQLKQMEALLALNKNRIDTMAAQRGIAAPALVEQLQGDYSRLINMPLKDDITLELLELLQDGN